MDVGYGASDSYKYCNDPKFLNRQVWTNSADPDQTAPLLDQGLHCLLYHLHFLDKMFYGLASLFDFKMFTAKFSGVQKFRNFMVVYLIIPRTSMVIYLMIIEPRRQKTGLRGFRPGPTQTGLYNHRIELEA